VITAPCKACDVVIEPELVAELLDELTHGGKGIELPILQVVLDTLYRRAVEKDEDNPVITHASYLELGKASSILGRFVEERVAAFDDPEPVRQILKAMVTAEGTRRISSHAEILERSSQFGSSLNEDALSTLLNRLIDERILREDADNHLFELRHDALAHQIFQWMTGIEQELMEVRQSIENRFKDFQQRGLLLENDMLEYLAPYEARLKLKGEIAEFVRRCKRRHRWFKLLIWVIPLTIFVIGSISTYEKREQAMLFHDGQAQTSLATHRFVEAKAHSLFALAELPSWRKAESTGRFISNHSPRLVMSRSIISKITISNIAISPDGRMLATGVGDSIRMWNISNGKELSLLQGRTGTVTCVAFSPDGKTLVSGSKDHMIRLWNMASGKEIAVFSGHLDTVHSVAFSPDGQMLASGSADHTIRLWDLENGKEKYVLKGHDGDVMSVSFSPNGQMLASGSEDHTIRLWDLEVGKEKYILKGHEGVVTSVSFSPDGKTLASGSLDATVRLWNVVKNKEKKIITGHQGGVFSVSFSPDGKTLATGSLDKTARLWDAETYVEKSVIPSSGLVGFGVVFSSDGKALAVRSEVGVFLWDITMRRGKSRFGHKAGVSGIRFSPDGKMLVSLSRDKKIHIWDVLSGKENKMLFRHSGMHCIALSPNGDLLAYGSGKVIHLRNIVTGKENIVITGHEGKVLSVVFSPNGELLASASSDKSVRLWEVSTGKQLALLDGHHDDVNSIAFSPNGKILASGSSDKTIRLWDVLSGLELFTLQGHQLAVSSVAFSPDGQAIASASWDGSIRLWNVSNGKEMSVMVDRHESLVNSLNSVAFSPNGKILISGGVDETIRLWLVESREQIAVLRGHGGSVNYVAFSPDGKTFATCSNDRTVRLWDFSKMEILLRESWNISMLDKALLYLFHYTKSGWMEKNKELYPMPVEFDKGIWNKFLGWSENHPLHWLPAAEKGDANAMVQLGLIYDRDGENDKALSWYQKAADAGSAYGKERLAFLTSWMKTHPDRKDEPVTTR